MFKLGEKALGEVTEQVPVFLLLGFVQGITVRPGGFSGLHIPVIIRARSKGGKGMGRMPLKPVSSSIIVLKLMIRQSKIAI